MQLMALRVSKLENRFSDLAAVYHGIGQLKDRDNNVVKTDYAIGQRQKGSFVICCGVRLGWRDAFHLRGKTHLGETLEAGGVVSTVMGAYSGFTYNQEFEDYFYQSEMDFGLSVGEDNWTKAETVEFNITNFVYLGNARIQGGFGQDVNCLELTVQGVELAFTRLADYEQAVDLLNDLGTARATCKLSVKVGNHSKDKIFQIVNAICRLLTIARGIQINWIAFSFVDSELSRYFCHHRHQVLGAYQEFEVIESVHHDATHEFLARCLPVYLDKDVDYQFGWFSHFLVEIHTAGFLDTRCLLLYNAMEWLCKRVNDKKKIGKYPVTLRKRVCDFVVRHEVPIVICSKCHALGTKPDNKYRGKGEEPCLGKGHKYKDRCDVGFYVECRNAVVHRGTFYSGEPRREYRIILSMFHKMLLRALEYEYMFIDRYDANFMHHASVKLGKGPYVLDRFD
ncbi:MAG: hypothetical protein OXG78_11400 [Chloroflexi bacterium]|nr:hypothetical protein [Chloroflexota bacterium]